MLMNNCLLGIVQASPLCRAIASDSPEYGGKTVAQELITSVSIQIFQFLLGENLFHQEVTDVVVLALCSKLS